MIKNFVYLLLIIVFIAGCDSAPEAINHHSLIYCSEGSPESFNPQLVTSGTTIDATSKQLYDRLIAFNNNDNSLIPALAKDWHITTDGRKITFYLRHNVQFHHTKYFTPTRPMTADDVIFSFDRVLNSNNPFHLVSGGKYPFFDNGQFSRLVKSIEKIDDYTLRFHLNYSDSSFLTKLATDYAVILSKEYADQLIKQDNKKLIDSYPIGTGPFKFVKYISGALIRYRKNQFYWGAPIKIDQLIYDITPRNSSRLTKLLAHECDVIAYPIAKNKINSHPELKVDSVTYFNVGYLGFNVKKAPFNDVNIRKAVSMAIDRQAILAIIYGEDAEIANNLLPKSSWANPKHQTAIKYNIEKAKSLLADAGFGDGFTMDLWAMPVQRAYNPNALKMAKMIKSDLAKINIKVNVVTFEWNTFLRKLSLGEHQSFLLGWSADHPDPDNFFTPLLTCASALAGNNRTFWCNKKFDKLLQQALKTTNLSKRKALYAKAIAIIDKDVPLLPIAHAKRAQARNIRVKGQLLESFGGIDFSHASLSREVK